MQPLLNRYVGDLSDHHVFRVNKRPYLFLTCARWEHYHEVPVLILACIQHDGSPSDITRGASIYPSVQNLLLAARGLGLGAAMTTWQRRRFEKEIKELLDIPENVETAALIPIGFPAEGVRYGPTTRRPVEEVIFYERWEAKG